MRNPARATLLLGALTLAAPACAAQAPRQPERAISAARYAVPAAARETGPGHGYSAQTRRVADCLATYPGYDPKSDRIRVRPGVTRPCRL